MLKFFEKRGILLKFVMRMKLNIIRINILQLISKIIENGEKNEIGFKNFSILHEKCSSFHFFQGVIYGSLKSKGNPKGDLYLVGS